MKKSKKFLCLLSLVLLLTNLTALANVEVKRTFGENRYSTSLRVAMDYYDNKSSTAIIASGHGFADALVGGVLAGYEDAPLFLSGRDKIDDEIIHYLTNLKLKEVYLLGGYNSLSKDLEKQLDNIGISSKRIAGVSRYDTAKLVAEEIQAKHDILGPTYYADGKNFPDALASGPLVVKNKGLLLLSDGSPISGNNVIALGGPKSVPGDVKRISGPNRYGTALEIADEFKRPTALLVDGSNYPDALSAGALASKVKANIILTDPNNITESVDNALRNYEKVIIIGGYNSVSENIEKTIKGEIITEKQAPKNNEQVPKKEEQDQNKKEQEPKNNEQVPKKKEQTQNPGPYTEEINHGDHTTPADLAWIDTNGNGWVTLKEAREAGIKLPISRKHWLYKYMRDRDGDGLVGERNYFH